MMIKKVYNILSYKTTWIWFQKNYFMLWGLQLEIERKKNKNCDGSAVYENKKRLVNYNRNSAHVPFECLLF